MEHVEKKHYYRCKSNPSGPLLVLSGWEAADMKTHPDYERVNPVTEEVIPYEEDSLPHRPILTVAKRKAA